MKNCTGCIILFFILFCSTISYGQEKLVKDLDGDNTMDSTYIDIESSTILCKLSTLKFTVLESKEIEFLSEQFGIRPTKSGFELWVSFMRAGHACQFRYDLKTKKIQLIGMSEYDFGNAANDGSGKASANLLTNTYVGEWNFYDEKKEKLIKLPVLKEEMAFGKIYLEAFDDKVYDAFMEKSSALYEKQKALFVK